MDPSRAFWLGPAPLPVVRSVHSWCMILVLPVQVNQALAGAAVRTQIASELRRWLQSATVHWRCCAVHRMRGRWCVVDVSVTRVVRLSVVGGGRGVREGSWVRKVGMPVLARRGLGPRLTSAPSVVPRRLNVRPSWCARPRTGPAGKVWQSWSCLCRGAEAIAGAPLQIKTSVHHASRAPSSANPVAGGSMNTASRHARA